MHPSLMREKSIRTQFAETGLLLALACALSVGQSDASTQQTTFQVTANVEVTCSVFASDLEFGTYDPKAAQPLDAQSNVSVDCTKGANWELGLDKGLHGADVMHRAMANDTDSAVLLDYAIYKDPAHTLNWGDTIGVDTITGVGTGVVQDIGAYGVIPKRQTDATAGGYADTITATLTF
jgi:spore coat protein U-like protein